MKENIETDVKRKKDNLISEEKGIQIMKERKGKEKMKNEERRI